MTDFSRHLGVTLYYWSILQRFYVIKLLSLVTGLSLIISYLTYYEWLTDVSSPLITDNRPPELSGALHTIFEEQMPEPETDQQNVLLVSYTLRPIPAENPLSNRHQGYGRNSLNFNVITAAARGRQLSTQEGNTISTKEYSEEKCSSADVRWWNRNF